MNGLAYRENPHPDGTAPDGRMDLTDSSGSTLAHAGLWWRSTPQLEGESVGAIGAFHASDATSARTVLAEAERRLRENGLRVAIGPLDGNTWRHHRFVIAGNARGPFLLEPRNPADFPLWWEACGYEILSRYSSSVLPLDGTTAASPAVVARLTESGVTIDPFNAADFDNELADIFEISLRAFTNNFLYVPQSRAEFLAAWQKNREVIDPAFVRIARRDGKPCGFVFGIPDLEARARGEKPALIVKTLAVDPQSRSAGLGSALVDELHRAAKTQGYEEAIHALQHETNTSLKITGRHRGTRFREYALFWKRL